MKHGRRLSSATSPDDRVGEVWEEVWGKETYCLLVLRVNRSHPLTHSYDVYNMDLERIENMPLHCLDEPHEDFRKIWPDDH